MERLESKSKLNPWYKILGGLVTGIAVGSMVSEEYIEQVLTLEARARLTENLIIVGVVWASMGRKVKAEFSAMRSQYESAIEMFAGHLKAIETKFDRAVDEMKAMTVAVTKDMAINSEQLVKVEEGFVKLNNRVDRLETKGE